MRRIIDELRGRGLKYRQITSLENPSVKRAFRLHSKRQRYKLGEFLIDDKQLVLDSLRIYPPKLLFVSVESEPSLSQSELLRLISELPQSTEVILTTSKVIRKLSTLEEPQPVIGVYSLRDVPRIEDVGLDTLVLPAVALWGVKIPGNLGTIIRDAVAFRVHNVILLEGTVDPYNPKVIRSAREAFFKVRLLKGTLEALIRETKEKYKLIATSSKYGTDIREVKGLGEHWVLLLGSEAEGLPEKAMLSSNLTIRIPVEGIDSLNVSSAAAITLFWLRSVTSHFNRLEVH